ncbi:SpoIID/LytB domain-containing protein [Anabaena sp. UHCC 0399]|uniref:SpoIID/LytB domain-containing protein n=1 Tax=Anabaena sp. UHCC 0399 TaxID=3110238 RepID=UPI002B1E9D72|nr:SpoIID/LytB domain-containing protein [Anabaena sp. UHCC 0399]MEA5565406.1 SpoIID/LytB domain-containing protein [Anabaena sp. UHCC 0399]
MRHKHHATKQVPKLLPSSETKNRRARKYSFWRFSLTVLMTFSLLGLTGASGTEDKVKDLNLRIGIVQRFGQEPAAKLQLEPTKDDRLKLRFQEGDKQHTLITPNPVQLETVMQPLSSPAIGEVLVLGTYSTYETAEDSANKWRSQGIEVEIAQPDRWQVWAKREVYNTPLLRRLLFKTVQSTGNQLAFINTQVSPTIPRVNWIVNGKRYSPQNVEISTTKNLIRVKQGEKLDTTRVYAGKINFQPNAYGTYTLVNQVPLEIYLRGVVPHEIGTTAPTASLESQAILARTYVLRNLRRFAVDDYELCANTHCQVYYGLTGTSTKTDQAIAATRGEVLTYNNQLVDALYSSTTGGVTAYFSDVWNGENRPYLRPVVDTPTNLWDLSKQSLADEKNFQQFISLKQGFNESQWNVFRWSKETPLDKIIEDLQKFLRAKNSPYAKLKNIEAMAITERSPSGRILELAVKTDIGTFTLHKDEVRSAFAAPRSTLFYIVPLNKGKTELWGYAFIGGGLGHGVGLSQTGAQNLAKLGWSSNKILQFYYPGTQIKPLNEEIKF